MNNKTLRVVMLCGHDRSSQIVYHSIRSEVDIVGLVLENHPSAVQMIRRRIKNLGFLNVTGQVLFIGFNRIISKMSQNKIEKLISRFNLNNAVIPGDVITNVESVNDEEVIGLLKDLAPDAVVVNGTRIISKGVLSSIDAPFINIHMGITPRYRGVHGGYWALASRDADNCGVTVHLVDQGIDTGGILYQDTIHPGPSDNFNTYPIHQIAKAIPLLKRALRDVAEKRIRTKEGVMPSRLWYHPTLLHYFINFIRIGVK